MILTALAGLALLQQDTRVFSRVELPEPDGKLRSLIQVYRDRIDPPKLSPKLFGEDNQPWMFEWHTVGLANARPDTGVLHTRFAVWSQDRKQENDKAPAVCRMLLRLWDMNFRRLKLDHNPTFNRGMIEVYMCWGGTPGGEHILDFDPQIRNPDEEQPDPRGGKVNTIYFYSLSTFTNPVEMAREVAHEYGHASLPAVGGFEEPEDWSNGNLGEKLYLTWLLEGLKKKIYTSADTMGATEAQLEKWVAVNVLPLAQKVLLNGPDHAALGKKGQGAMDAFLGLALYAATVLPEQVFSRSLRLTSTRNPADYPGAVALAAEEPARFSPKIPAALRGKPVWVPLGKGKVLGATVLKRSGAWAQIQPGKGEVSIYPVRSL